MVNSKRLFFKSLFLKPVSLLQRTEIFFVAGLLFLSINQVFLLLQWSPDSSLSVWTELASKQLSHVVSHLSVSLFSVLFLILPAGALFTKFFWSAVLIFYWFHFLILASAGEFITFSSIEFDLNSARSLWSSLTASVDSRFTVSSVSLFLLIPALTVNPLKSRTELYFKKILSGRIRIACYASVIVFSFSSELLRRVFSWSDLDFVTRASINPVHVLTASMSRQSFPSAERFTGFPKSAVEKVPVVSPQPLQFYCSDCRKNLILIILESAGALNVLDSDGKIDAVKMPYLRSRSENSVVFDSVYPPFPATSRSQTALQTGGLFPVYSLGLNSKSKIKSQTIARTFEQAGFKTALVSAQGLAFEGLLQFYHGIGFQKIFAPDLMSPTLHRRSRTSSWGISDKIAADAAADWWKQHSGQRRFLQFLTHSTHHPYVTDQLSDNDLSPKDRYLRALRFVDKTLHGMLGKFDDLENTVIAVTGDHGEAFGDLHVGNLIHRAALYEENIRSFLLLIHPQERVFRKISTPVPAGIVAPTLAQIFGLDHSSFYSKPFSSHNFGEPFFFFKKVFPMSCGIRAGHLKSIFSLEGIERCEVYDLTDGEQRNVFRKHPELCLPDVCRQWLADADAQFLEAISD
ncbi:MAG: hypothetical protein EBR09_11440 [Proteobacteria bacterium]|nr:hypothetical protein [Pseudomonadota bacterium]